jgi:hypothetical protein
MSAVARALSTGESPRAELGRSRKLLCLFFVDSGCSGSSELRKEGA